MTNRMVGHVLTFLATLSFSAAPAAAQTYTQMQWGMNKTVTPYQFGVNINGTWSNFGTISPAGVWAIPSSNIVFTPSVSGAVPTTVQAKLRQTVSIKDFGAVGDGVVYDTAAFTAAFSLTTPTEIRIPAGTYRIACNSKFTAAGSLSLVGDGKGVSIIKLDAGCTLPANGTFEYAAKNNIEWSNLTFDLNTPTAAASTIAALQFTAYSGNANNLLIHDIEIKNGTSPVLLIGVGATAGNTYSNVKIERNYLSLSVAAPTQNQCLALTTLNNSGYIPSALVSKNICVNSAIQVDGAYTQVIDNDVSGFRFGSGIYLAHNPGVVTSASSHDCIVSGNVIHDTDIGLDVNNVPAEGVENNCYRALISNNLAYNLGGAGFYNYGSDTTYVGNIAYNNGKKGPIGGQNAGDVAGFVVSKSTSVSYVYESMNVKFIGNVAYDNGTGTQLYGLYEAPYPRPFNTILRDNNFSGALKAISKAQTLSPMSSNWEYVSERDELSSTGFEWTGLDQYTAFTYWQLECNELAPVSATTFGLQIGQGATPTWQTGANYTYQNYILTGGGPPAAQVSSTSNSMLFTTDNFDNNQVMNGHFTVKFGRLESPGWKSFTHNVAYYKAATGSSVGYGNMYFNANSDPITAIRLVTGSGNFKGRCTLMGRP